MAEVLFWCAALLLVHTYFLYPVILFALDGRGAGAARTCATCARGEPAPQRPQPGELPRVSLVVAAYNEASCIEEKLRNSLALDYPAERFEVLIGSDGSTDGTDEHRPRCTDDPGCGCRAAPRAGKTSVLNRCIPIGAGRHRGPLGREHDDRAGGGEEAGAPLRGPRGGRGVRQAQALQPDEARLRGERVLELRVAHQVLRGQARRGDGRERRALRHPPHALHRAAAVAPSSTTSSSRCASWSRATRSSTSPRRWRTRRRPRTTARSSAGARASRRATSRACGMVPGLLSPTAGFRGLRLLVAQAAALVRAGADGGWRCWRTSSCSTAALPADLLRAGAVLRAGVPGEGRARSRARRGGSPRWPTTS